MKNICVIYFSLWCCVSLFNWCAFAVEYIYKISFCKYNEILLGLQSVSIGDSKIRCRILWKAFVHSFCPFRIDWSFSFSSKKYRISATLSSSHILSIKAYFVGRFSISIFQFIYIFLSLFLVIAIVHFLTSHALQRNVTNDTRKMATNKQILNSICTA